jgi:hypothetical protein
VCIYRDGMVERETGMVRCARVKRREEEIEEVC